MLMSLNTQLFSLRSLQVASTLVARRAATLKAAGAALVAPDERAPNAKRGAKGGSSEANLVGSDLVSIVEMCRFLVFMPASLVAIVGGCVMLFTRLGFVPTVCTMVLVLFTNTRLARVTKRAQKVNLGFADQRLELINEALRGIRSFKLFGWEPGFESRVAAVRDKGAAIFRFRCSQVVSVSLGRASPALASCVAFMACFYSGEGDLDYASVFAALSVFQALRVSMIMLPQTYMYILVMKVSFDRLDAYLFPEAAETEEQEETSSELAALTDATFVFPKTDTPALEDVTLCVRPGEVVAVVGAVGAGKTCLLARRRGVIENQGSRARRVRTRPASAASPARGLRFVATAGDLTEVGERGVTLSGGQQARVSLCRALYARPDLLVADDPLSALDVRVAAHVFEAAFRRYASPERGVLLALNQMHLAAKCDRVVVVVGGRVVEQGPPGELSRTGAPHYAALASARSHDSPRARGGARASPKPGAADYEENVTPRAQSPATLPRPLAAGPAPKSKLEELFAGTDFSDGADVDALGMDMRERSFAPAGSERTNNPRAFDGAAQSSVLACLGAGGDMIDEYDSPPGSDVSDDEDLTSSLGATCMVGLDLAAMAGAPAPPPPARLPTPVEEVDLSPPLRKAVELDVAGSDDDLGVAFYKEDDSLIFSARPVAARRRRPAPPPPADRRLAAMVGRPSAALSSAMFDDKLTEKEREAKGALVEAEFQRKEAIAGSMYRKYLENFGVARFWCTATVCGASYGCFALGDWSLSRWIGILDVDGEEKREDRLESDRAEDAMWLYGIFVLLSAVLLIATSVLFSAGGVRAAKTLHRDCLHRVLRAPLSYFDATPTGRLTSRFSADLSVVDLQLSFYVDHVFQMSGQILVFAVLIAAVVPPMVARLANAAFAPLMTNFSEILASRSISPGSGDAYVEKFFLGRHAIHAHDVAHLRFCTESVPAWANLHATLIAAACAWATALVVLLDGSGTVVDEATAPLALTYSVLLPYFLSVLMFQLTTLRLYFSSFERLQELCDPEHGPPVEKHWAGQDKRATFPTSKAPFSAVFHSHWDTPATHREPPAELWPSNGSLRFADVTLRYRPGLPPALEHLNLYVEGGTRVGVIGRTGAGKSSLVALVLRLVEPEAGRVLIDGLDVAFVGLCALRKRVSMVPQDNVLLSGSVDRNLDPFEEHGSPDKRRALDAAGLGALALDHVVKADGGSLSAGEKQLLGVARALLRKTKVVVMDEPSSNVDEHTDAAVQRVLKDAFVGTTSLTIAHRLETVIDSDMILTMDAGAVAEFDHPANLLDDPDSRLNLLLAALAPDQRAALLARAKPVTHGSL
ncbi:ATPase [Aureococcus anophagefferens]|nr:ATPase [Aureococcus anophagefferens]